MAEDSEHIYSGYDRSDYEIGASDTRAPALPTYRPLDYLPKRPSVSTSFEQFASHTNGNGYSNEVSDTTSPSDPHDFYRRRSPYRRDPAQTHTQLSNGHNNLDNGITTIRAPHMSSAVYSSPLSSRYSSRYDARSTPSPSSEKSAIAGGRSNPHLAALPRNRQTSLQELVNKFNQTPDEVPPIPSKPGSRSTSTTTSPATAYGPRPFRARAPSDAPQAAQNPAAKRMLPSNEQGRRSPASPRRRKTPIENATATRMGTRARTDLSTVASNSYASQSVTDLAPASTAIPRKPLFGEVLPLTTTQDPGYGIQGSQRRRGSEGSMHTPNPMFTEDRGGHSSKVSPSSPTAWYLGVTPSLDGIDLDKPVPARPPGMHRRSRSDYSGSFSIPNHANSLGQTITVLSPTQEAPSPFISPTSNRNSQSRIPVSTHRTSVTSDSGNSSSSRAPSSMSHQGSHWKNAAKPVSALAKPKSIPTTTSPEQRNTSSSSQRSPRRGNLSSLMYTPGSPRLAAYISETQPTKSPPLRSSRPRQPVSTATTSASRARAAERITMHSTQNASKTRDRRSKPLPELVGVDFAARRAHIEQAVTKTVKQNEEKKAVEAERKRMSMVHELRVKASATDLEPDQSLVVRPDLIQEHSVDDTSELARRAGEEQCTADTDQTPKLDRDLTIQTGQLANRLALDQSLEDSPTLGVANRFMEMNSLRRRSSTPPSDSEPTSAVTAGTAETLFDQDQQEDLPNFGDEDRSLLRNIMDLRAPSPQDDASPHLPDIQVLQETDDAYSDRDDRESIRIMLGETPVSERADELHVLQESSFVRNEHEAHNRWSADSWTSSMDTRDRQSLDRERDAPMERIEEHAPSKDGFVGHSSLSTTASTYNPPPWTPGSASSLLSGHTTLDSDSYSTINKVLDSYHDSSLMSPESIKDLQQRVLTQSPNLARAGGWDPKKVTQLYLQSLGRTPYAQTNAVPEPLRFPAKEAPEQEPFITPKTLIEDETVPSVELAQENEEDLAGDERHSAVHGAEESLTRESLDVGMANPQRASLNHPEDWADTSPSMLDWFSSHRTVDSPTEDKPLPIPWTDEALDVRNRMDGQLSSKPEKFNDRHLQLPEIPRSTDGLGLETFDITVDSPHDEETPSVARYPTTAREIESSKTFSQSPSTTKPVPPIPTAYDMHPLPPMNLANGTNKIRKRNHESPQPAFIVKPPLPTPESNPQSFRRYSSDAPAASSAPVTSTTSPTPEQKNLTKRRFILKELVDTESSFGQDMKVVNDIYKGTSNVLGSAEDVKILFGNSDEVVAFSTRFLDALKQAARSVYVLPKSRRWKSKRDSEATMASGTTDDQASPGGLELTEEGKDRQTFIGAAFKEHIGEMEKVYGEYSKNHEAAMKRLQVLMKIDKVNIWLNECSTWAHDLTTAWDLGSLLVKPVQRLLKYPLLLEQLLNVTPENHPDFLDLDFVAREIKGVSRRINDSKKRIELVTDQISGKKRKDKDKDDGRLGLKAFARQREKLKQQVGLTDNPVDEAYDGVAEKFGMHFFQVQVVMRDIEMYTSDIQAFTNRFNDFVLAIEQHIDVGQTTYPEVESKWRKFRMSMREILMTALTEHITNIRKLVVTPLSTLLKMYEEPQRLMKKREKRILDYAKFKAMEEKGFKPDRKTTEAADLYVAINESLKDELPKLFAMTGKLVIACLNTFVQLQLQWQKVWRKKLSQIIDHPAIPDHVDDYIKAFRGDFEIVESQVLTLGICNGSVLADTVNFLTPMGTSIGGTTLNGEESPRRPSTNTVDSRTRGYSQSNGVSPMLPHPDFGDRSGDHFNIPNLGTTSPYQPGTGRRIRASSTASGKSPKTPEMPGTWRQYSNSTTPVGQHSNRPSTSTGRSTDSPSLPRLSVDTPGFNNRLSADSHNGYRPPSTLTSTYYAALPNNHQQRSSSPIRRASGIFSSSMPMTDSPRTQSPVPYDNGKAYNVLFLAASVYEFYIDRERQEAGFPYLCYVAGEIFDVIGEKGEIWLAKNQDDHTNRIGWIWSKHFAKLAS